ncbi:DUF87 domain-containing protein [bacterium]|nr:DUF87 domain-containing protein [bacterium]
MSTNELNPLETTVKTDQQQAASHVTKEILVSLIQKEQYVGEVYSISYQSSLVQIHDLHRQQVGGIPGLSFLIATRINPDDVLDANSELDHKAEDTSIVLLRVMDAAPLPNEQEATRVRVEAAQRASEESDHWDSQNLMDSSTHQILSFAGVKCRVIGTFFLDLLPGSQGEDNLTLYFGCDLSNYYPNRGLKVYKPNKKALEAIVNYRDPLRMDLASDQSVEIGKIRYASTNRSFQGISDVPVKIMPVDLLGQKTALFGMTRTGKSNTTKIILKSIFDLRVKNSQRIGQIVFDPNGEYANENVQDENSNKNPSAIKNIWQSHLNGSEEDVITYGISAHPNDPDRKLMLLNFFLDENLQIGKEIIDISLQSDGSKYIQNFRQVVFVDSPDPSDRSANTRYRRRVLAYRALLSKAGFKAPEKLKANLKGLFNKDLIKALIESESSDDDNRRSYRSAAETFKKPNVSWEEVARSLEYLDAFITDGKSDYSKFEDDYIEGSSTKSYWADDDLKKVLAMFRYPNGSKSVGKSVKLHTPNTTSDYADDIYQNLTDGKLVIIDQSSGDPEINQSSAERIMWKIFQRNQELFRSGQQPHEILVYLEEAHNLLPSGTDMDLKNVWVRTAKEGAKYHIGMVYTTQEVSSIQRNILKNTANWLIGHLNNTDETKELRKYYDFADFEDSILRAQDKGFLRVKTLSNLFVIPVQIKKFEV